MNMYKHNDQKQKLEERGRTQRRQKKMKLTKRKHEQIRTKIS